MKKDYLSLDGLNHFFTKLINKFATKDEMNNKVDKIDDKGLSTNDYTDDDKEKLANLSTEGLATEEYVNAQIQSAITNLLTREQMEAYVEETILGGAW